MAETIKVVLAGCGGMSGAWLGVAKGIPDLEIVALVDIREEAARKRAADFELPDALISTDLKSALEQISPDVNHGASAILDAITTFPGSADLIDVERSRLDLGAAVSLLERQNRPERHRHGRQGDDDEVRLAWEGLLP